LPRGERSATQRWGVPNTLCGTAQVSSAETEDARSADPQPLAGSRRGVCLAEDRGHCVPLSWNQARARGRSTRRACTGGRRTRSAEPAAKPLTIQRRSIKLDSEGRVSVGDNVGRRVPARACPKPFHCRCLAGRAATTVIRGRAQSGSCGEAGLIVATAEAASGCAIAGLASLGVSKAFHQSNPRLAGVGQDACTPIGPNKGSPSVRMTTGSFSGTLCGSPISCFQGRKRTHGRRWI
jgi:hypothetical protein